MDKQTVTIDLARYEELVKKEAIFDKLMDGKGVEFYLTTLKTQPQLELSDFVVRGGEG